ncbi:MAG TPA: Gfo/Idh/MocA family oxidoreductase [Actinomycetota bacterium]|nr:Gfo/Idh/MocA family oxidoreductase [Actinomycetota bacterium]
MAAHSGTGPAVGGETRVRIGVIGVGRMGIVHAGTLVAHPGVDTVFVTDLDRDRAEAVAAKVGAEIADSVENLLRSVDAIVIAAATSEHAPLIRKGADAGLPTFCEKPITLDLDSTADVARHVAERGIQLQIGFQRRFDAGFRAARELVNSGGLGTLYVVRMAGHDPEPPHEEYIPASGGIFRDFSVHDFDALRFVTGEEVVEVYADGGVIAFPVFAKYDDVDTAVATLRLSSGAFGILSVTRHDPLGYDVRMELLGSGDNVVVGLDGRAPIRSLEGGGAPPPPDAYTHFSERFRSAYVAEMEAFVDVAAGRRESPCTAEEAFQALRIAVACDLSRKEHRPVSLEEVA